MKMFNVSALLVFSILVPNLIAQQTAQHEGKYALQFQIGQNFNLTSFQGATISGKYNFSEQDAVRLGVTINTNSQDNNYLYNNSTWNQTASNSSSTTDNNYMLSAQYLRNNYYDGSIVFYYGGGPNISYAFNLNTTFAYGSGTRSADTKWIYGLTGLAGVEWYFIKNMSLSAEYGITFNYYDEVISGGGQENRIKGTQYVPNSVKFGLSVYF